MGVTISKPAINIREKLTEASAVVPYEQRQFHFDGLVTNGTFDTDTDWTKGTGWTISSGVATHNQGAGGGALGQELAWEVGKTYLISATIDTTSDATVSNSSLGVRNNAETTNLATLPLSPSISKEYTLVFTATETNSKVWIYSVDDITSVDNISVYEIDPSDNKIIHTMPKGWKPLHVFEDGVLQREGSAYDYTVEYDGFNYIVKETVAPVAPYSTTVIGVRA